MNDSDSVLKVVDVTKVYRLGKTEVQALRGVSLKAKKGDIIAVMGASGSGKTTLLNLIGALDTPTSGKVFVDGTDLSRLSEGELTEIRRKKIGFIFQFYNLIPVLTAYENVELPMLIAGVPKADREARTGEMLKMVGLAGREDHRPDELSGGEQQRVAIARVLARKPSIILADEPTGDLDSETGKHVVITLRDLAKSEGVTVVMVTHDMDMANLADRILQIRDGRILKQIEVV